MLKWTYSETVDTKAGPAQIWATWQDVEAWPRWDDDLDRARLEGPFENGTKGRLKPASGPAMAFELADVVARQRFSTRTRMPLTDVVFEHEYLAGEAGGPARFRHSVVMTGLLAPLFGQVMGRSIKAHLRGTMLRLSDHALSGDGSRGDS